MPWEPADAPSHTKQADTARKRQVWAEIANAELKKFLADGMEQGEAESRAIRAANAAVARIREGREGAALEEATWDAAYVNDLPDSAFLYIEPGGEKDSRGKTVPRSLRHFPYRDADGEVDEPHLRNALARIPQSSVPPEGKRKALERARGAAKGTSIEVGEGVVWAILLRDPSGLAGDELALYEEGLREESRGRPGAEQTDLGVTLTEGILAGHRLTSEDKTQGIIRNVAVLRTDSVNEGRHYLTSALASAVPLFEGARLYADHPDRHDARRSVRDLIGRLSGVRMAEGMLRGDMNVLTPHRPWVMSLAEEMPDICGLSWRGWGRVSKDPKGQPLVEAILKVLAVELVAEPAAVRGLFESRAGGPLDEAVDDIRQALALAGPGRTQEARARVTEALDGFFRRQEAAQGAGTATAGNEGGEAMELKELQEKVAALEGEKKALQEERTKMASRVEVLEIAERQRLRLGAARQLCEEVKVPAAFVSDGFVGHLAALPVAEEAAWKAQAKALAEERREAALKATGKPVSESRDAVGTAITDDEFVAAFRGR